jgi:hypothetical protein
MQFRVEQVLFRSLLARRFGLSPGGYLLLLAGLRGVRVSGDRGLWAMLHARGTALARHGRLKTA